MTAYTRVDSGWNNKPSLRSGNTMSCRALCGVHTTKWNWWLNWVAGQTKPHFEVCSKLSSSLHQQLHSLSFVSASRKFSNSLLPDNVNLIPALAGFQRESRVGKYERVTLNVTRTFNTRKSQRLRSFRSFLKTFEEILTTETVRYLPCTHQNAWGHGKLDVSRRTLGSTSQSNCFGDNCFKKLRLG